MKKAYLFLSAALIAFSAQAQVTLQHLSTYSTGIFDEGAAEIVTYDYGSQQLFFTNADDNSVGILDFSNPASLTLATSIDMDAYGDGVNSVSAKDGYIAVAVEIDDSPGLVVFFDTDGQFQSSVEVGYLPDMVTFSPDGNTVVVACEGEPNDDWTLDPPGTVGIIDVSGGIANLSQGDVTMVTIGDYSGSWSDVRVFGPDSIYLLWENFQDTALQLNEFTTYNELSSGTWYFDDFAGDYFAEANGYGDDTSSIDWLISPAIDLRFFDDALVSFENTKNFSGGSLEFLISTNYSGLGDPSTAQWDTLTGMAHWSTGGYSDTNSGPINLSSYSGHEVHVAFLYTSTGNGGGDGALWQIDDIAVSASISTSANLEPEYVAISDDNSEAYVVLQENNAIAVIDLATGSITNVFPLGYKDHSQAGMGLDPSDKDNAINITTYPFRGLYQPDAAATINIEGTQYILTANEGDARDYDGYSEEKRLEDLTLDATAFPDAVSLQAEENGGRINVTTSMGDTDGDGDYDEIYTYGARSFSIWDTEGNLVFDSGDEFEQKIAELYPDDFNAGNDANDDFEGRSDNKGPEPEAVEVATVGNRHIAFIGLERFGGVMVYDITDPTAPVYQDYVNNRNFSVVDVTTDSVGDLGCEDVLFIDSTVSPDGKYYIVTSNEVSGTVSVFEVNGLVGQHEIATEKGFNVYPNPASSMVRFSQSGNYTIVSARGEVVMMIQNAKYADVSSLAPGYYLIKSAAGSYQPLIKH